MTEEQKAAVIYARVACAVIRAMGMQAGNSQYPECQPYSKDAFDQVIIEEGIHWNAIHQVIFGGEETKRGNKR
jgi:hypothetical protein